MAELTEITSAITTVGFPIAACCALFYLYNQTVTKITTTLELLNKSVEMLVKELKCSIRLVEGECNE